MVVFAVSRGKSLFCRAAILAAKTGFSSIEQVQRAFRPGYAEAGRVVDLLAHAGIVGAYGADHRRPYMGGVVI